MMESPISQATEVRSGSGEMFDRIADRYDLLNRIMSLGMDQAWRKRTVDALALGFAAKVLDVATGTGDLALRIAKRYPSAHITGLDPSTRMLAIAERKVQTDGVTNRVSLCKGDAQALPFDDRSFDGVCIAFGIRNVFDRPKALAEMCRVSRSGARLAVLELSEPGRGALSSLARFHVHTLVPALGALLSGRREYRYLEQSIAAFPPQDEFVKQIEAAGFSDARARALSFGAVRLYTAVAK